MNGEMKRCGFEGEMEKCDCGYQAKCEIPGKVDLTCLYYVKGILNGRICTAPPKKIVKPSDK
jgi:hypothetical protein